MLRNVFSNTRAKLLRQTPINKTLVKNTEFKFGWDFLIRKFDLRMWFVQNSWNLTRKIAMAGELEQLHYNLNYLHLRGKSPSKNMAFWLTLSLDFIHKYLLFFLAAHLYLNYYLHPEETNVDW